MKILDENGSLVNHEYVENIEQRFASKYIKPHHKVLELGARYGSVSIITNKIVEDKSSHYVVEPDKIVWEALENNMKNNDCNFNIIKGIIGSGKHKLVGEGYAKRTIEDPSYGNSQIEVFKLPEVEFNALIVDCEGYLETFYNENKELFSKLELMIIECDEPKNCNYDFLFEEFAKLKFKIVEQKRAYCKYFILEK